MLLVAMLSHNESQTSHMWPALDALRFSFQAWSIVVSSGLGGFHGGRIFLASAVRLSHPSLVLLGGPMVTQLHQNEALES